MKTLMWCDTIQSDREWENEFDGLFELLLVFLFV